MARVTLQSMWEKGRRWLRREPIGVGVDVGSHALKLVSLRATHDRGVQARAVARPAPPLPAGSAWLDVEAVAGELRDALQSFEPRSAAAAIALPSSVAVFRRVVLPPTSRRGFARKLAEALDALDLDPNEDWNVDYELLGAPASGAGQEILFVAAPSDCVATYVELLRQADLDPVAVDVDVLALVDSCRRADLAPERVTALVDIGERSSNLHLLRGHRSLFEARLAVGVGDIRESLVRSLHIDPAQAIDLCERSFDAGSPESEAVGQAIGSVAEEIHHTISFFWTAPGDESIDQLRLSGGGAAIGSLRRWLESRLAVPCHVADPIVDMQLALVPDAASVSHVGPEFALAAGLAHRCLEPQ